MPEENTSNKRPNIILVMTDEHRWDALGCAGNPVVRTPNIDGLAREGVRFSSMYCQGPLCQPSRASTITGKYVHQHGQTWNRWNMDPSWPTMMKQLQKAGYTTACTGKTHFYWNPPAGTPDLRDNDEWVRSFGFDYLMEEFDRHLHVAPGVRTPYLEFLRERGLLETYLAETHDFNFRDLAAWEGKTSKLPQDADLTSFIGARAVDFLREYDGERPFFLWVSFVAPHPPLTSDPEWSAVYEGLDFDPPPQTADRPQAKDSAWGAYLRKWFRISQSDRLSREVMLHNYRHYYAMISLIDQWVGEVHCAAESRWPGETWVIFTSDHGDTMGDHGMMFKHLFYKGSVLVPGIVRPAGGMAGKVIDAPSQSIDLTGAILDLAGAEPVDGAPCRSLVPQISGDGKPREVAFSELAGLSNEDNYFVMAATDRYRYTYDRESNEACELFDLREDPLEVRNLVDDAGYEGVRKELQRDLVEPFLAERLG